MKKVTYHSYQPSVLVNKIKQIKFERPIYMDHALKLSNIIIHNCMEQDKSISDYIDVPSNFLKEVLTEKYGKVIRPLIDQGVLVPYVWCYDYKGEKVEVEYKVSQGQCKRYRLNPFLTQKCNWILAPYKAQLDPDDLIDPNLKAQVIKLIKGLSIDLTGALSFIDNKIESIKKEKIKINEEITEPTFEIYDGGKISVIKREEALALAWQQKKDVIQDGSKFYIEEINSYLQKQKIKINHEIKENIIELKCEGKKPLFIGRKKALELASQQGKDLIQDAKSFLIEDIDKYVELKKERIKFYYTKSIKKLQQQIIYAKRNKTNLRLDTNITQLPSDLIPYLTYKGESLINIDLSNSQFSIFSYLISYLINKSRTECSTNIILTTNSSIYMCVLFSNELFLSNLKRSDINKDIIKMFSGQENKLTNICAYFFDQDENINPDVHEFMAAAQKGILYEDIVDLLELAKDDSEEERKRARKQAKTSMFEVAFSSHRSASPNKELVKKAYPSILNFIKAFKKTFGDNQFSILLQVMESTIFIDLTYPKLHQSAIMAISKHDSFLVPESQVETATQIIENELKNIGLKGNLGIECTGIRSLETDDDYIRVIEQSKDEVSLSLHQYIHSLLNQSPEMFASTYINFIKSNATTRDAFKKILADEFDAVQAMPELQAKEYLMNGKKEKAWNPSAPKFAITKKAFFYFGMAA